MSGADLANLVNEAALHAVRRGGDAVHMEDFEAARDRVLMGQRRETMALSEAEKERVAYHEGGHAVLAYVLPDADPVHKVTILPTGMALGVTQQLPMEERHIYPREYIEDSLCVRMGGRVAELLVYGDLSTGANNDLVGNTELARKMVREWGMSERIGPMAWGSQGMVFLGDDLMHTRDYSDETSRVIDEEVERILREQEARATVELKKHRKGLDQVAASLLERETIDGEEVRRLVDDGYGKPVHDQPDVPRFGEPAGSGGKTQPTPSGRPDPEATPAATRLSGAGATNCAGSALSRIERRAIVVIFPKSQPITAISLHSTGERGPLGIAGSERPGVGSCRGARILEIVEPEPSRSDAFWRRRALKHHGLDEHGRPRQEGELAETTKGAVESFGLLGMVGAVMAIAVAFLFRRGRRASRR